VDSAYIIELKPDASLSARSSASDVRAHEAFHKRATTDLNYETRREFTNPFLFYGLSIQVQSDQEGEDVQAKLESIPGVANVWPVMERCVPRPTTSSSASATASSTDTLTLPKATGNPDVSSTLRMTDIDKLHAMGIKGKGMKVGIVDTGIDYRHPSLGGGFGPGHKVAGGYAYVDDNGKKVSIQDPLTTCPAGGHGTHCAGIVGMQDPADIGFGLVGVAPEVEIYAYRVFGCTGGAATDNILAALAQAHADGVDVVSMSLGLQAALAGPNDPFAAMTSALVSAGIAVVAAAGNDGALGPFNPSTPGINPDVIAVGCIENTVFPTVYGAVDSGNEPFNYASIWPLSSPPAGLSVYVLQSTGCAESEWIAASQAVTNKDSTMIIFQSDTSCSVTTKVPFWTKYGFRYIMGYPAPRQDPYSDQYILLDQQDNFTYYTYLMRDDGLRIAASYASAGGYPNYKMVFSNNTVTSTPMKTAGMISYFSSYGPDWDTLSLKPQLSAPGASILATWPLGFNSGYAAIRGTSMATPFIAASYALVKSQFPNLSVWEIRELLQSTSTPVLTAYEPDRLATVVQQGAGLVNPYKAIMQKSTITPTQFEIGDGDDYEGVKLNFTISNRSPETRSYTFAHIGAGLVENYGSFYYLNITSTDGLPAAQYASASFSDTEVTVESGKSATVYFSLSPPADADARLGPVMSGFVSVDSSAGEKHNLPYEGLAYSRGKAEQLVQEVVTFYNGSGIMEINKRIAIQDSAYLGPFYGVYQPNLMDRVDVLPANTTFVPTYYGYDMSVPWDYQPSSQAYSGTWVDGKMGTYAVVSAKADATPQTLLPLWNGISKLSPGDYRFLISILKWGGNTQNLDDWVTWLSPIFR
ncbi:subtilisin-like protein, partial [Thozetella sp. PMI_491]